jgi:hypothetical protein
VPVSNATGVTSRTNTNTNARNTKLSTSRSYGLGACQHSASGEMEERKEANAPRQLPCAVWPDASAASIGAPLPGSPWRAGRGPRAWSAVARVAC